jgi:hypothetical protein
MALDGHWSEVVVCTSLTFHCLCLPFVHGCCASGRRRGVIAKALKLKTCSTMIRLYVAVSISHDKV